MRASCISRHSKSFHTKLKESISVDIFTTSTAKTRKNSRSALPIQCCFVCFVVIAYFIIITLWLECAYHVSAFESISDKGKVHFVWRKGDCVARYAQHFLYINYMYVHIYTQRTIYCWMVNQSVLVSACTHRVCNRRCRWDNSGEQTKYAYSNTCK